MCRLKVIASSLSMASLGLWLILAASSVQAKVDTGYLGMGEWRPDVSALDDTC